MEAKVTKEYIIKVLGEWLENHEGQNFPSLSYEAAKQLYEALTEDADDAAKE